MNLISRTITGIASIILGIVIVYFSFESSFWLLLYGIPIIIIGVFILFNKKEDKIEKIRRKK
ncbi:hypothetical protein HOC80_04585 [archaeon]|jgi:hypothetical protein|nr:hypothetical protein [archaeon]MBT4417351.1 hypothetical protein [archaeon]